MCISEHFCFGSWPCENAPVIPATRVGADFGAEEAHRHVVGRLSAFGKPTWRVGSGLAPDQVRIAFISGPMPMMFMTRVRL
jgi:hypothetical protein